MMTRFLLLALGLMMIASCAENIDTFDADPIIPTIPDFEASAFIEVVDPDGAPLEGVTVRLGNLVRTTDDLGIVHLEDVEMSLSTYITADYSGYFHGSRRFYPSEGNTHFVRIMMLPSTVVGGFDAASGGSVTPGGGVTINFPANSVVDASGTLYTGQVDVASQPLVATDPNLSDMMPGDLVGNTEDGARAAMASFGMVAVELRGSNGQLLNVADGKEVEMRMDVPQELEGSAPATIPMWYFDEATGYWEEDGQASFQGGEYVGMVDHFTYWNYDAWFPIVKWGAQFTFNEGTPASQVAVCITIISMETSKCSYTNENGIVCGMVAANEVLLMEVKDQCGNVVYSEEIGPFSDTTFMGPIEIPETTANLTSISGCVVNCDDLPVEDGFVQIKSGEINYYASLDDEGCFEKTFINCNSSDVVVTAVDEGALKQSLPYSYDYAEEIDAGTIEACEDITEFIQMNVDTFPSFFWFLPYGSVSPNGTLIRGEQDSSSTEKFFYLMFDGTEVGTYDGFGEIGGQLSNGEWGWVDSVEVVVTYFGETGDVIQGTFNGTFNTGQGGQGGEEYPMDGSFSVIRED